MVYGGGAAAVLMSAYGVNMKKQPYMLQKF